MHATSLPSCRQGAGSILINGMCVHDRENKFTCDGYMCSYFIGQCLQTHDENLCNVYSSVLATRVLNWWFQGTVKMPRVRLRLWKKLENGIWNSLGTSLRYTCIYMHVNIHIYMWDEASLSWAYHLIWYEGHRTHHIKPLSQCSVALGFKVQLCVLV